MSEEYQIEGNITEISNCLKPAGECSFTFVPGQNYTVTTVDGQKYAVIVAANTQNARQLAYDQKLVCDISGVNLPNLSLGKFTVIFVKKNSVNNVGINITIKSDLGTRKILNWKIIKYGIKL